MLLILCWQGKNHFLPTIFYWSATGIISSPSFLIPITDWQNIQVYYPLSGQLKSGLFWNANIFCPGLVSFTRRFCAHSQVQCRYRLSSVLCSHGVHRQYCKMSKRPADTYVGNREKSDKQYFSLYLFNYSEIQTNSKSKHFPIPSSPDKGYSTWIAFLIVIHFLRFSRGNQSDCWSSSSLILPYLWFFFTSIPVVLQIFLEWQSVGTHQKWCH